MLTFAANLLRSQYKNLFLVLTPFPDGRNAWYFIRVQTTKTRVFRKAVTGGPTNLRDYGEILRSGWGKVPPQEVITEMKAKYGYLSE